MEAGAEVGIEFRSDTERGIAGLDRDKDVVLVQDLVFEEDLLDIGGMVSGVTHEIQGGPPDFGEGPVRGYIVREE